MATDPLDNLKNMGLNLKDEEDCKKIICMDESDALKKYNRKLHKNADSQKKSDAYKKH